MKRGHSHVSAREVSGLDGFQNNSSFPAPVWSTFQPDTPRQMTGANELLYMGYRQVKRKHIYMGTTSSTKKKCVNAYSHC
jgi:hypothetical protein